MGSVRDWWTGPPRWQKTSIGFLVAFMTFSSLAGCGTGSAESQRTTAVPATAQPVASTQPAPSQTTSDTSTPTTTAVTTTTQKPTTTSPASTTTTTRAPTTTTAPATTTTQAATTTTTAATTTTQAPTTTTTAAPANPGDSKNCSDFSTHAAAQAWFDKYFPYYGDIAKLDADHDGIACESLP